MIAKTTTGNDFEGALTYGAGQRQGREKKPGEAPLLVVANVIPGSPAEMARDMRAVAALSKKIRKPVWHTVLSWREGEVVSQAQKVAAARRYCELMGAPIDRHQVVVYEHRDKQHAHIHIYLNRVPVDGGPALRTDNNFYRQPAVARQISQELGMQLLPGRRMQEPDPAREQVRERIKSLLHQLLAAPDRGGEEWLTLQLQKESVSVRYTHDRGGILRGVSFAADGVTLRGQEVGYRGAQLRRAFASALVLVAPMSEAADLFREETAQGLSETRWPKLPKRPGRKRPTR